MDDKPVFHSHLAHNIRRLRSAMAVAYLVAFVLLAATVNFGIVQLQSAHHRLEAVMAKHNRKVDLITQARFASFWRADTVQLLILETDPFRQDEVFLNYLKSGFQVGESRNQIRPLLSTAAEKAALAEQDAIIAEVVDLHDWIADLARSGRHGKAAGLFVDRVAEPHRRGHATFQRLHELQTRAAAAAIDDANAEYHRTLHRSILGIVAGLLVGIAFGVLVHRASGRLWKRLRKNVGELQRLAMHDSLTELLNRPAISRLIERKLRQPTAFAVLYMDLDGFKQINDLHGHEVGDRLLVAAATRICSRLRGIDTVGRLGGDEFVATLTDVDDPAVCKQIASNVIDAFRQPFVYQGIEARIGISIGIALAPFGGNTAAELLGAADTAMYRAKRRGSNSFEIVAPAAGAMLTGDALF